MSQKLQILITSFLILMGTTFSHQAVASHAMGADLTYQCLGGNTYKVRLSFYRDCIGIPAPANVYINVRSASCNKALGVTAYPLPGTGQQVTYLCPTATTTCNGGTFTGIQEWVYEGVVTLPMQCTDWQFSYSLCCRNAAITTITNPGSNTFYIYANLNNVASICNSSPTFSNKPVPFACLGQQLCFNHGAIDADGDSLVYSLVNPQQTATAAVAYSAPYNAANPLASSPAMQFNTATGDVCFTPTQLQVTVMAVLVKEYRNGVLIGSVVRDIQVTVLNCSNDLPNLSGINGTTDFDMTVCANTPTCFNVFSNDPNVGQNLSVFYNNAIQGGTFTSTNAAHPTATFCWTPTQADISNTPHCFTLRVGDDACPYIGSQTYSYCITVTGIIVNAGPDQYIACSDLATISASATGGTGPYTYLWSNGYTNPTQTVPVGTYVVTVSDGTCSSTDTVNVISAFQPTADFTWSGGCAGSTVNFTDASTTQGGINTWTWNFGDGTTSGLQNPTHTYPTSGTYNVTLLIENIYGCVDTIVKPVTIVPIPLPAFTVDTACVGSGIHFINTSSPSGLTYSWSFSNGSTSGSSNPTLIVGTSGNYSATLIVLDSLGCGDTLTKPFVVHPQPIANFNHTGSNCLNTPISFTNTSTGSPTSYTWNFGDGSTSTATNPTHSYASSGTYNVSLIAMNSFGCFDTIVQPVFINLPPVANAGPDQTVCLGSSVNLSATGGVSYSWTPGSLSGNPVSVSPSNTTNYVVIVTDANGCTAKDTIRIRVNQLPVPTVSGNQTICVGQSATLSASGGQTYYWNPSGSTSSTINVSPGTSTSYAVNVVDSNGCQATGFVNITVRPNPIINLQAAVFICSGVNATLNAGTGTSWLWSNGSTSQTISVNNQGIYTVTVTNQYGCSAVASTQVTVGGQTISNNTAISICQGQTATISAGYAGSSYLWSNGSTASSITATTSGAYTVTITDANGCSGTVMHTLNVHPLPVPNFTPYDVCINTPVQFTDVSSLNGDTINSWSWDLGDGNVSYQQNPLHYYLTSGTYPISLTLTTSAGCTASLNDTVNVYPLPQALFSHVNACSGNAVTFNDNSTTGMGVINYWSWSFGDGTTSSSQHPSHVYAAPGTYNVTLIVGTAGGCLDSIMDQVVVFPKPLVAFNPTITSACAGSSVSFTNSSTTTNGSINSWIWNFGNGQTSTAANPSAVFTTAGTYTVSLIATTSHGCTDTLRGTVTINSLPNADAGSDANICRGTTTTLTATGGTAYLWSPGGSSNATINVSPNNNTTYYVTVTNAAGCTARDSARITVMAVPIANAGADKSLCLGGNVNLTATGGGTYSWTPGNLLGASVSVNPAATTNYIVTVTSSNGCTAKDTVKVNVNQLPIANAGPDQTICEGVTATLTATGGSTYYWQYNGATTSTVYVNPIANSSYVVTVTSAAGCIKKDTVNVNLVAKPIVTLPNAFFCTGFSTVLNAGNPGMTYDWSPTGESTQSIVVSTAGVYQVVVTNAAGCQGTAASTVIESGSNLSSNAVNAIACQGSNITLNAGNSGVSYLWSNGATSQTINVNTTGSYTVTITDASGCSGSIINNVTIHPKPTANFVASNACLGLSTTLVDGSNLSSGNIMSWSWTLPNGMLSNTQFFNYTFPSAGTYPVKLIVTSGNGCVDSIIQNVTIYPVPTAQFSESTVCEGNATVFANQSSISAGSISTYYWNFGDGSTGIGVAPSHTYASAGNYITTLVVQSALGCIDTLIQSLNVNPNPIVSFSANDVCHGDSTEFINSSYVPNGILSDINWDFGDGASSTDLNPKHKYVQPGTYQVTLSVGSDQACNKIYSKDVTVNARPSAAILAGNVCDGLPVSFVDNSTISSGTISGYYWNFGDGTGSNNQNETHQYLLAGTYNVVLLATSDKGCLGVAAANTSVFDMPLADFSTSSSCEGAATNYTDLSVIPNGTISSWDWSLGDGNTASGNAPSHTYANPGNYIISLVVTSASGCKDTLEKTISVYPVPLANFASGNVCLGDTTNFFDQSQVLGGSPFTYSWNLGDGTTSSIGTPSHLYATAGTFPVLLTVTTPFGCSNTIMQMVNVYDHPNTDFISGNVCMNSPTLFMDASTVSDGTITGWSWTLGDGTNATAQNPSHFYNTQGVYTITLETTSNHGCRLSVIDSIEVYGLPTPSPISGTGCVNNNISLMDTSSGPNNNITTWEWDFGNGIINTNPTVSTSFATSGTHTVSLTTTNANGCRATNIVNVIISPLPVAGFIPSDACANSSTVFTNTSTISSGTISGYFWDFGDGFGISTSVNPSYSYLQPGTYTVTMIATSNEGCSDTITHIVTIFPLPVPNFLHISAAGCGPLVVNFTDSSYIAQGSVIAWFWDFGDGKSSTLENPSHTYEASGTYNVTLTVTSNNGCENSITVPNIVTVYPAPIAEFEPDPAQTSIIHPEFNFTNLTSGGLTYQWTFGDGTGNSQFEPNHMYADTGTYMVTLYVTNSYGCRDTVKHPVRVLPEFEWWVPNAFSPNEDGVNDGFNVKGISIVDVKLSIFNRWGDQIFYSEGRNNRDWDGSVVGVPTKAQEGVYVYQVKVQDVWGKFHEKVGQVFLVR